MQKFGYLNQNGPQALIGEDALVTALKLVQEFGGLKQTGKLDNDTLKVCALYNKISYIVLSVFECKLYYYLDS